METEGTAWTCQVSAHSPPAAAVQRVCPLVGRPGGSQSSLALPCRAGEPELEGLFLGVTSVPPPVPTDPKRGKVCTVCWAAPLTNKLVCFARGLLALAGVWAGVCPWSCWPATTVTRDGLVPGEELCCDWPQRSPCYSCPCWEPSCTLWNVNTKTELPALGQAPWSPGVRLFRALSPAPLSLLLGCGWGLCRPPVRGSRLHPPLAPLCSYI